MNKQFGEDCGSDIKYLYAGEDSEIVIPNSYLIYNHVKQSSQQQYS